MSEIIGKENESSQNTIQSNSTNENDLIKNHSKFIPQEMVDKPCGCGGKGNCSCGTEHNNMQKEKSFIYAVGRIQAKFSSPGIEKEYIRQ